MVRDRNVSTGTIVRMAITAERLEIDGWMDESGL